MGQPVSENRECSKCGETRSASDFYSRPDGRRDSACKPCRRAAIRLYATQNADKIRSYKRQYHIDNREKRVAAAVAWGRANPERRAAQIKLDRARAWARRRGFVLAKAAGSRARERGLPFRLDHLDIQRRIDAGRCELSGIPFDMTAKQAWNSPSLDRIELRAGYVDGNVRVILRSLNIMINDWGLTRALEVFRAVESKRVALAHGLEA